MIQMQMTSKEECSLLRSSVFIQASVCWNYIRVWTNVPFNHVKKGKEAAAWEYMLSTTICQVCRVRSSAS